MSHFEKQYFKAMQYTILDSMLRPQYRFEEMPKLSSIQQFFGQEYNDTVRLIYANKKDEAALCDQAKTFYQEDQILVNPENMDMLRNLETNQFVLVTKPENMRGLDYRSKKPITLFLNALCDSKRSLVQAFGRVGRY